MSAYCLRGPLQFMNAKCRFGNLTLGGRGPSAGIIIWEKSSFGSTQIHLFKAFNLSKQKQLGNGF